MSGAAAQQRGNALSWLGDSNRTQTGWQAAIWLDWLASNNVAGLAGQQLLPNLAEQL